MSGPVVGRGVGVELERPCPVSKHPFKVCGNSECSVRDCASGVLLRTLVVIVPRPGKGNYDGTLDIRNVRIKGNNALVSLLNAISVVGLLQQLDGSGIHMSTVDGQFALRDGAVWHPTLDVPPATIAPASLTFSAPPRSISVSNSIPYPSGYATRLIAINTSPPIA